MNNNTFRKLATLTLLSALVPAISLAAPRALLEKGQTFALDNEIRGFQIPTIDSFGKIKYYDMTVTLTVNDDGTVSPIADVVTSISPTVNTRALIPGTYKSIDGRTVCKITNITLTNGRIQSFVNCRGSSTLSELSFASGAVTAEHPNYPDLVAAGVNKRTDVNTQTWGIVTNGSFRVGSCYYATTKQPIGIKTNGKTLVFSVYSKTAPSTFQCSGIFNK